MLDVVPFLYNRAAGLSVANPDMCAGLKHLNTLVFK